MKISVIIPVYNAEKTIENTLESVLNQTTKYPIEIIIVNDGSSDQSQKIVERIIYRNNTSIPILLFNKNNEGVSKARNLGVKASSGEFIAFLDSDDVWHPRKLEILIKLMNDNYIEFIGHSYTISDSWPLIKEFDRPRKVTFASLLIKNFAVTPSIVLRKSIFEDFNEKMTHTEDHELWLRLALKSDVYFLDQPLVKLGRPILTPGGLSSNIWKMRKGEIRMYVNIVSHKKSLTPVLPLLISFSLLKHVKKSTSHYMKKYNKEAL